MAGTASRLFEIAGFGIKGIELLGSATTLR
jgi:hypothetical protein